LPAPPFVPGFAKHSQGTLVSEQEYGKFAVPVTTELGPRALLHATNGWRANVVVIVTTDVVVVVMTVLEPCVVVMIGAVVAHTAAAVEVIVLVGPATVACHRIS
jgi:hypothetical protein